VNKIKVPNKIDIAFVLLSLYPVKGTDTIAKTSDVNNINNDI
jgi:hypothetical protein